jgi:hypothetical protein
MGGARLINFGPIRPSSRSGQLCGEACSPDTSHDDQEPQRGIGPRAVLSLCPLLNSAESEGA